MKQVDTPYYWCFTKVKSSRSNFSFLALLFLITLSLPDKVKAQCSAYFYYSQYDYSSNKINFTDNSSAGSVSDSIISWKWDFAGQGSLTTAGNAEFTFDSSGYHDVTLMIATNGGCYDTITTQIYIYSNTSSNCGYSPSFYYNANSNTYTFTNTSTGGAYHYKWYFGDGSESYDESPTYTYNLSYSQSVYVYLYAYDSAWNCYDYTYQQVYVEGNSSCNLNSSYSANVTGSTVAFTNTSSGDVYSYHWYFGDGYESTDANPTHTYNVQYSQYVYPYLYVYDSTGNCYDYEYQYVWIEGSCNLQAYFTASVDSNGVATFENHSTGDIGVYSWYFYDDYTSSYDQIPTHTFASSGYHYVYLTVYDSSYNCYSSYGDYVNVQGSGSTCLADFTYSLDSTGAVQFSDLSLGNSSNTSWSWYFGDGGYSYDQNPTHYYANGGWYWVSFYTYDYNTGCSSSDGDYVYIPGTGCSVNAYYKYTVDQSNYTISVQNQSSGSGLSYSWTYYNGYSYEYSYDETPTFTYYSSVLSTPYLELYVWDGNNCSSYYYEYLNLPITSCQASFSYALDQTDTNTVHFYDYSWGSGSITDWSWDFGDGNYSTDQNPDHTYAQGGYYSVTLTANDKANGCVSSYSGYVYIPGSCNIKAEFAYTVDQANNQVIVTDKSIGAYYYYWEFYDGTTYQYSYDANPVFTYNSSSTVYSSPYLYMSVNDQSWSCYSYSYENINIPDLSYCQASFGSWVDATTLTAYLYDYSYGSNGAMTNWSWDFGDGSYSTDQNPSHTYAQGGYYTVTLTAKDNVSGCASTYSGDVYVPGACNIKAEFAYTINETTGQVVVSDNSIGAYYYYWYFYDGINYQYSTDANPVFTYDSTATVYSSPSLYLSVYDQSWACYSYTYDNVNIGNLSYCQASFGSWVDASTLTAYFYDYSYGSNGSMTDWFWYFGDGSYSTDQNPTHTYAQGGYYTVTLTAKDSVSGCASTYSGDVYMPGACNIKADFTYSINETTGQVVVSDNSIGGYYYYWYFYDGINYQYSTDANPVFTYDSTATVYSSPTLYLSVYDQSWSCYSYIDGNVNIPNLNYCEASFGSWVDASTLTAYFYDYSYGSNGTMTNWSWSFGDGSYSTDQNPTHTYAQAGYYNVKLTTKDNASGCASEYESYIYIPGACNVKADFTYSVDQTTNQVIVSNSSIGAYYYYWYFWDGANYQYSSDENPVFTYNSTTNYYSSPALYLSIYDQSWACYSYTDQLVNIPNISYCQASYGSWVDGSTMTAYFYDYSYGSNGSMTNWSWNFGDGSYSTDQNPTHTYAQAGYYNVKLTTKDNVSGCASEYESYVYIPGACNVNADFTYTVNQTTNEIVFSSSSVGSGLYYYWYFWDGTNYQYSYDVNPTFTYGSNANSSPYVYLYVYDANWCSSSTWDYPAIPNLSYCQASYGSWVDGSTMTAYFYDYSYGSGAVTNWGWDFGDGSYSTDQNPIHTYSTSGYYQVKLTTKDAVNNCVSEYESYVYIPGACNVNASFTYVVNQTTNQITYTNTSIGTGLYYYWYFWNGSYYDYSYDANPTFTYASNVNSSPYVYLYVYDANWCSSSTWDYPAIPNLSYCQASYGSWVDPNTMTAYFYDYSYGSGAVTNWSWSFGDGSYSTDQNPTHTYVNSGYYQVKLTTKDVVNNCVSEYETTVYVPGACNTNASFTYVVNQTTNQITLTSTSIGTGLYYYWYFWNGNYYEYSYDVNPVFNYSTSAISSPYVYLYVYDANWCSSSTWDYPAIPNLNTCQASYGYWVDGNTMTGYFYDYSYGSNGSMNEWSWDFGDGNYSHDQNPTNTYSQGGYYLVKLVSKDTVSGCVSQYESYVYVPGTCNVNAAFTYTVDQTNNQVVVTNNSIGSNMTYYWYYWDGVSYATSYDVNPVFTYSSSTNIYPYIYLGVYDDNYCSAYYSEYVVLPNVTYCTADYAYVVDQTTNEVTFTNLSWVSGSAPTTYYWYFDDGYDSYDKDPEHTFATGGYHSVYSYIEDSVSGCTSYKYDYVYVPTTSACQALFTYSVDSTGVVYFDDNSIGDIGSWYWYFDDGTQAYTENPTNKFPTDGFHYVYLSVYDSVTACQSYYYDFIYVPGTTVACNAYFGFFVDSTDNVYFTDKSQGTFTNYYWEFGDVNYSNSNAQDPTFNYGGAGNYYVCLSVYDSVSGCQASYCDYVTIVDTSSTSTFCAAEYTYYPDSANNSVYFKDKSVGNVNAWYWNFGDGTNASSDQNPTHAYSDNGYYKVSETVWTANGCQETYSDVIAVGDVTYSCYAEFSYYANKVTSTAHFKNLSQGNITSYYWDFGDGYSSVQKTPSHTYADTGYYAVCLTVYSDSCSQTFCDVIRVGNAISNPCKFSCVWPGDANSDLEANHYDLLSIGLNYGYQGPKRDSVSIMWIGHSSTDWATWQSNGANNRHADCNGDGTVDLDDVVAIDNNFAYSHPYQMKQQKSGNELTFEVLTTNIYPGGTVEVAILAGDSANVTMYGVGWELGVDPAVVVMSSVQVSFANSWLGTQGADMLAYDNTDLNTGKVYMSSVRNDHNMKTDKGEIARVTFTIDSDANGEDLSLELTTFGGINNSGDTVPFTSGGSDTITINSVKEVNANNSHEIRVYPNPTNGSIAFSLPTANDDAFDIKIYNSLSQVVYHEKNSTGGVVKLDLTNLSDGMYSIDINSAHSGRFHQRFDMIK